MPLRTGHNRDMALRTDPTPAIGNTLSEHSPVSADKESENHRATVLAKGGSPYPLPMGSELI